MESAEMLLAIQQSPIVSIDTLRPDHLCKALISEADRLGLTLDRDLWQPAAAIAAHGMRGIVLKLPPKLEEISGCIVSGLFDALNWHAPMGKSTTAFIPCVVLYVICATIPVPLGIKIKHNPSGCSPPPILYIDRGRVAVLGAGAGASMPITPPTTQPTRIKP